MSNITCLGLGAMGSRMAASLLKTGHRVTVWNRSAERAAALVAAGAVVADTPRAAVRQADVVMAMTRDDNTSREIWLDPATGALDGMREGAIAVESSTLSPAWVQDLARHAAARAIRFVDAPVVGSRPQADAGQLIFLAGGDAADVALAAPVLECMGSAVHRTGPVGSGALLKLAINALFAVQVTAMAELIGALDAAGADIAGAIEIIGATPVASAAAKGAASAMLSGRFAPLFPVELVAKDLAYVRQLGTPVAAGMPMTTAAAGVMQSALAHGFGGDNLTGIVRLFRPGTAQPSDTRA
ncbi:putative 3-hydroxyisobutyrate dehydrogenase family protein [Bradyrhizobium sp. ORS 278]|uniref:NAD(P)-dependent oxidoreductase n=1 Tax=Bradyrhizobium sp. (strain ORS 278) TaxID=114615 RepID=UPI0001508A02|nr:NAD(P)-dependent oxidoreductase [Bradyrhizobium sp. ORS 278]CAL79839.1 putative 3-hydroxyisobutyrate dehydrogenase family protein [Bradyrhizobium sp. ORS 278]